ncbi:MAG: tetratricopeptide repeat protein [Gemmatimonadales bacterium]
MAKGPEYSDPTDFIRLMRVVLLFGCPCFVILGTLWYFMLEKGWISQLAFVLLTILTFPITAAGVIAIHRTVGNTAVLMVKTMFADGDIPPPPTYPRQDVLIAQGKYAEAAEWFRDHIRIEPDDHEARLRLALLVETHLKGYDEAEQLYLKIRNAQPPGDPRQLMQAANHLIDLYRKTGRTDRLQVELARFCDRYRGSPQAAGAARELKELKSR